MYYVLVENGCRECPASPHIFGIYEDRDEAYNAAYTYIENPLFAYSEEDKQDMKASLSGNKKGDIVFYDDEGEDHSLRILEITELNTFYDIISELDDTNDDDNLIEMEELVDGG